MPRSASVLRGARRAAFLVPALLCAQLLAALLPASGARAHAFLERSDPAANSVLPEQPAEVRLWFTEPLERDYSSADLYDRDGNQITDGASRIGEDNELILTLPEGLATGTYTVQWRNVSAADGHPEYGYVPFTIGSQADVAAPVIPAQTAVNRAPAWLDALGRWLALLGVSGAAGSIVCWLWVLRVAQAPLAEERQARLARRAMWLVLASIGVALLGSVVHLLVQTHNTGAGVGLASVRDVLVDTRYGHLWVARLILLGGLAAAATTDDLWPARPSAVSAALALGVSGALLLPFSLNAHAAALDAGRSAALAADWLHLAGTAVWIGGLLALLIVLVYGTRGVAGAQRRQAFALAVPRFTTLAIASVLMLALTGLYSAWLHVGNLTALRETDYGRALSVKLLLVVPILVLGALNMRVIGPRLRDAARPGSSAHFGRAIAAEAALGVGVLFAVGLLTTFPTGRDTLVNEAGSATHHIFAGSDHVILYLSPGAAGANAYTLDVGLSGRLLPQNTEVLLRFSRDDDIEGTRELALAFVSGQRWQGEGSELSVVGDWDTEVILRQPGQADLRFRQTIAVPRTPPAERVPGAPPVFAGWTAAVAVLFIGAAVFAIVALLRAPGRRRDRLPEIGSGVALLVAGIGILLITREPATPTAQAANPVPRTAASVAAGRELFLASCARCHGNTARGDGPDAPTLERAPADLTAEHVDIHSDGDLHWWIANGIAPAMPGFADELSDEQLWHLVNYVRALRESAGGE